MPKLFKATFKDSLLDELPDVEFDDIDDLTKIVDEIEYTELFFTDDIVVEMNTDIEIEGDGVLHFISQFDKLNYDLMVYIGQGDYDQYWEEKDCNEYYQYQYLMYNNTTMSAEDAIENCEKVNIYYGNAEDYAREYVDEMYELPVWAEMYFDYEKYANNLIRDGELIQFKDTNIVWITNGNYV